MYTGGVGRTGSSNLAKVVSLSFIVDWKIRKREKIPNAINTVTTSDTSLLYYVAILYFIRNVLKLTNLRIIIYTYCIADVYFAYCLCNNIYYFIYLFFFLPQNYRVSDSC